MYLGFSVIYSALGGRLPKVEKKHIDEALEKPYSEAEFEAELKKRNEFLGRFILGYERQLVLNSFTQGAIAFVLKSVFMAADEEIQWLDKRQKT